MPTATRPNTTYMDAVDSLLQRISDSINPEFKGTVTAVLVGGVAVHVYTGWRVSKDLDVRFSHRIILPENLLAVYEESGERKAVSFDTAYTEAIALLHPDCWKDAYDGWAIGKIRVMVLSPVDLAVSKIGRWAGNDEADVQALATAGLLQADEVEARCKEALDYYIGNVGMVRYNLRDALEVIRSCSPPHP